MTFKLRASGTLSPTVDPSDTPTRDMSKKEIAILLIVKEHEGKITTEQAARIYEQRNGRRGVRAALQSRWKPMLITHGSPLLECALARRKLRRERQGKRFHPIYGYRGIPLAEVKVGFTVVTTEDGVDGVTETVTPKTVISNKDVCKFMRRIK